MDEPPNHLPAALYYAKRFSEMQSTWNDFSPGKGQLLEQASALLDRKARRPDNWAGLNIPDELERRLGAIPNPAAIKLPPVQASALLRSAYAQLGREAHPHSSRLEPDRKRAGPVPGGSTGLAAAGLPLVRVDHGKGTDR